MASPGTPSSETKQNQPDSTGLVAALTRLNAALDGLENAVETKATPGNVDEQVQRMADDRAKLARDLDETEARAKRLNDINSEVSRRLVGAMEMVRGVLDKQA